MDELTRVLWDYACQCRLEASYDLQTKKPMHKTLSLIRQPQQIIR